MTTSTLSTYLDTHRPGWREESDADVLAWLEESVTTYVDISWLDLGMWVAKHNLRPSLVTAATATGGTAALRTTAQHILDCITAGQSLYASDERVRTVIGTAMPDGPAREDLVAMATTQMPRYRLAGLSQVLIGDIGVAR